MFNNKETETDFCDSYKSEILGSKNDEKGSSLFSTIIKLLTILILLVIIVGVSFYGYNYFTNSQKVKNTVLPPVSVQISDDELVVEAEEPIEAKIEKIINEEKDIEEIADEVKIAIAKSELAEENETKVKEESLEVPTSAPEAKYLEELADLSKEIDKERK